MEGIPTTGCRDPLGRGIVVAVQRHQNQRMKKFLKGIKAAIWGIPGRIRRLRLKNRDFTVISNNCWGAEVYQRYSLPYTTPFVGLFIYPEDFLELLQDLRGNLAKPLTFLKESRHPQATEFRRSEGLTYPIGLIGERIEVHFQHYASEQEAREKWTRRLERANLDKDHVFLQFNERDGCTLEQLTEFDVLPYRHKVCFTAHAYPHLRSMVQLPAYADKDQVGDGVQTFNHCLPHFDLLKWLNG